MLCFLTRFSPCILLYLLTVIPPVWVINLSLFGCMHAKSLGNDTCNDYSESNQMCVSMCNHYSESNQMCVSIRVTTSMKVIRCV